MATRIELFSTRIWAIPLAGLAACIGLLAGLQPALAIAAALGCGFVVLVFADLAAGTVAFVLLSFLELLPTLGGSAVSLPKLAGALLALSWLATVAIGRPGTRDFFREQRALVAVALIFLAWVALSVTWAESHSAVGTAWVRYLTNIALLPILYTAVRKREDAAWITGAFVAGACVSAAYGLVVSPSAAGDAGATLDRISGTLGDPNELAAVLVAGLILGIGAARAVTSPFLRLAAIAGSVVCGITVFLTLSRGGLLALAAALLAGMLIGGRSRTTYVLVSFFVVLSTVTYFGAVATPAARDRIQQADGGSGRTDVWKVAWRAFEDKPVYGVGANNFSNTSIHYLLKPGALTRSDLIVERQEVAHNTYLQILAELGAVGMALFAGIVLLSIRAALRASRAFRERGDPRMEQLARAVAIATVGILAADFFLTGQFGKQLWILIALGPALQGLSLAKSRATT